MNARRAGILFQFLFLNDWQVVCMHNMQNKTVSTRMEAFGDTICFSSNNNTPPPKVICLILRMLQNTITEELCMVFHSLKI